MNILFRFGLCEENYPCLPMLSSFYQSLLKGDGIVNVCM
jgi:hypothetical protein